MTSHVIRKLDMFRYSLLLHSPHLRDMDDSTTADIANLLESSGQSSQQPQSTGQESDQTLEEVLAHTSTDVIHTLAASINESAMRETGKTEKFTQGICRTTRIYADFVDRTTGTALQS